METREVEIHDLGRCSYREAWELQRRAQQDLIAEKLRARETGEKTPKAVRDLLIFVEHPHVYTLGKSGNQDHLLMSEEALKEIGAEFVPNDRGGDITYHGPGQIVGYPILDLERYMTDIHKYLRSLEEVIIRVCADFGVEAGRSEGLTGVWVADQKICAMGIRCSRWVTMHGFALNVHPDLSYFGNIVPCGIQDRSVTSLKELIGEAPEMSLVKERIVSRFEEVFGVSALEGGKLSESETHFSYLCGSI